MLNQGSSLDSWPCFDEINFGPMLLVPLQMREVQITQFAPS
jgi:hypothetical protein